MRTLSIIHPSRQRASQARDTINKWISRADKPEAIEYIVSVDSDDPQLSDYSALQYDIATPFKLIIKDNATAIQAINYAATKASGDLIIVVSDDTDCFLGWDTVLLNAIGDRKDFCIKTRDGIQDFIITMPIVDRDFYERVGYVYNPAYTHMYVDSDLACITWMSGHYLFLPLEFKHLHYSKGLTKKDFINIKNDSTYASGKAIFLKRYAENFGLKPEEIVQELPEWSGFKNFK